MLYQFFEARKEAPGQRTIDDAMVEGERQRHHRASDNRSVAYHGLLLQSAHRQDRHLGIINDWRAAAAAEAADVVQRKRAAAHLLQGERALLRALDQMLKLCSDLQQRELIRVAQHRHHQSLWRIGSDADVIVSLVDNRALLLVEAGVEDRELLERRNEQLDQQGHVGETGAALLCRSPQCLAQRHQFAAVKLIEGGSVRHGTPRALHMLRDAAAQPGERLALRLSGWCWRCWLCRSRFRWRCRPGCFLPRRRGGGCLFSALGIGEYIIER